MNSYETQIYRLLGSFWTRIWKEPDLVSGLVSGFAAIYRDLDGFEASLRPSLSRLDIPLERRYGFRYEVISESDLTEVPTRIGEFEIGKSFKIGQPSLPLKWNKAIKYSDVSMIVDRVSSPSVVYVKNQDFIIDGANLVFLRNPLLGDFSTTAKIGADGEVEKAAALWLLSARLDTGMLDSLFGGIVGWTSPSTAYAKRLLNRVWDLRVQGATRKNVLGLLTALVDADISDAAGTVGGVWSEAGRNFISVGDAIYSAPSRFAALKAQNDPVEDGESLFDVVDIYSGADPVPESVCLGLCVDSSLTGAGFKDGLVFVNKEVALDYAYVAGDPGVVVLEEAPGVLLVSRDGSVESVLEDGGLAGTGIVKIPIFDIGGDEAAVLAYRRNMAQQCWKLGIDLWTKLTTGRQPPYTINPMKFVQDCAFGHNMLFIRYTDPAEALSYIADRCLSLLDEMVPAGTSFLLFQGSEDIVDAVGSSNIGDSSITPFLAGSSSDSVHDKISDRVKTSSKQY